MEKKKEKKEGSKQGGKDALRDVPLRYLGYASHIAALLRPFLSGSVVNASNLVATGYMFADVYEKGSKVNNKGGSHEKVVITVGDAIIWQALASSIIPGWALNRISYHTRLFLRNAQATKSIQLILPMVVGLCTIPIIAPPIDRLVDILLDETYRKWFSK